MNRNWDLMTDGLSRSQPFRPTLSSTTVAAAHGAAAAVAPNLLYHVFLISYRFGRSILFKFIRSPYHSHYRPLLSKLRLSESFRENDWPFSEPENSPR